MKSFDKGLIDNLNKLIQECQIIIQHDDTSQRVIITILYPEPKEIKNIKVNWGFIIYNYEYEIPVYSIGDIVFNNVVTYSRKEDYECPEWMEAISWECPEKINYDESKKRIFLQNYTTASRGDSVTYDFIVTKPELGYIQKREFIKIHYDRSPTNLSFGRPTLEKLQNMRFWAWEKEKASLANRGLCSLIKNN